jgi:uncharacterized protein with PQ loop repeat
MMLETILGVAAGTLTSIRLFPQMFKTVKIKKTDDLSLWFLILLFFQALLLIGYGLTKPDVYIVSMNIIPLLCSCVLLELKHKYSTHAKEGIYESRSHMPFLTIRHKFHGKVPHLKKG